MSRRDPGLTAGLLAAYALFARTFRAPRPAFWSRMTTTAVTLGGIALWSDPAARRTRFGWRDLVLGGAGAGALYGVFRLGDRIARAVMPRGGPDIEEVYALRSLAPAREIAARLAVIGPAEELFWRGFVQGRLSRRLGPLGGAAAAAAAYGGAHVVTRNATLVGAASVAGAFWSAFAAAGVPMGALIVSHVAWDVLILLVAPTSLPEPAP